MVGFAVFIFTKKINESLRQQKQKEKEGYLTRSRVHLPPKRKNRQSICSKEGATSDRVVVDMPKDWNG